MKSTDPARVLMPNNSEKVAINWPSAVSPNLAAGSSITFDLVLGIARCGEDPSLGYRGAGWVVYTQYE
jgi:hypothetical protein